MMRIEVEDKFKRQDATPLVQPPDFTVYAEGAKKTGLISQEGLFKREADKEAVLHTLGKIHSQRQVNIHPKVGDYAVVRNQGVLLAVDKFFNWLNRVIGE